MASNEQMFFFALGQLTAENKGEGFVIVYRKLFHDHSTMLIPCERCMYKKRYHGSYDGKDIVDCRERIFALGYSRKLFHIRLHVGRCEVCNTYHIIHGIESLKNTFKEDHAQTTQDHD